MSSSAVTTRQILRRTRARERARIATVSRGMSLEASHTQTRSGPARWFPDARRARRCKPGVSTAVGGGGHGRRQGAPTTAMVHQDLLACAPTDRASEPGPQGAVASAPG